MGFVTIHRDTIPVLRVASAAGSAPSQATKQDFIEKFCTVFDGGLGAFRWLMHLEVCPEVRPVQMPLRQVHMSFRDKLKEELHRLNKLGVLKKIYGPTEWVSGLVVAEKKEGDIPVCKPLNKALRRPIYPLPTMENV